MIVRKSMLLVGVILGISIGTESTFAGQKIHFPCSKRTDGKVLVDGPDYDNKLASLGYHKRADKWGSIDYHISYKVIGFEKVKDIDQMWMEGVCYFELIAR
jgi:hypothetical protein